MRPRPGQEAAEQPLLQITVAPAGESPATVIKVAGELDESTQDQLITTVDDCLRHHAAPVRLDLAGLTFLGSAGIGALLQCRDAAVQAGHTLELVDPQPSVHHVLDIVNLLPTFGLAPARVAADRRPAHRRPTGPQAPSTPAQTMRAAEVLRRDAQDTVQQARAAGERARRSTGR